ncbi:hypothetical protein [Pseudomonas atagonensis]|uniref:hypothetical protein n=1 Tax=Pseudomonas atagonensis TaxID=2609964 RepID=UPI001407A2B3|nr:hypothetical protein [Pseudomonas atagonensis]
MNTEIPKLKPKFNVGTRRQEAEFAGYRCSRRGCGEPAHGPTIGKGGDSGNDDEAKAIPRGQGAHIYSSSPDGPRGHGGLNKDKLAGANNCLHVCPKCHNLIDSATSTYTVDVLVEMKWLHKIVTRVINSHAHLESKLIEKIGNVGSARYRFEEFLLSKTPSFIKVNGALPAKPKIDDVALNYYVNEFFSEQKAVSLELPLEDRLRAAEKLKETISAHSKGLKKLGSLKAYVKLSYALSAIKVTGEHIHTGETYSFNIRALGSYSLFQRHTEECQLGHKIGFDVSGSTSLGIVEFDSMQIRLSTSFSTVEFLHAAINGAKIYYDVEATEIVEGNEVTRWKLNRGEAECQWNSRHQYFSSLKSINMRCLNARSIAKEFGVNFLPAFNSSAGKGGVRPGDVSGLSAYGLTDQMLSDAFDKLGAGSLEEQITLRSAWCLEGEDNTGHLECNLTLTSHSRGCNMNTYLYFVIDCQGGKGQSRRWFLSDGELTRVDYILELPKTMPEGEILREFKALLRMTTNT